MAELDLSEILIKLIETHDETHKMIAEVMTRHDKEIKELQAKK